MYGYVRENDAYRVEKSNTDTIVFFCHFGLECVLLGHLLNISLSSQLRTTPTLLIGMLALLSWIPASK